LLVDGPDEGHIYLPMSARDSHAVALLVRPRSSRDLGADTLQQIFRQVGTDPEVFEALPLGDMRALQLYPFLAASWIGSLLASIALALGVSGLYGVLTYMVSQRAREIGIRMALGATSRAVVRLVIRQSTRLAGLGAIIGVIIAFAVLKVLSSWIQLRSITLLDLAAFAGGLTLVMAAVALAAYHPARRATRIDPAQTLRADA
jgi:putative ABC transport system permease protein